jgi:hypothetical protein
MPVLLPAFFLCSQKKGSFEKNYMIFKAVFLIERKVFECYIKPSLALGQKQAFEINKREYIV